MSDPVNGIRATLDEHRRRLDEADTGRRALWQRLDELTMWRGGKDVEMTHLAQTVGEIKGELTSLRSSIDSRVKAAYTVAIAAFALVLTLAGIAVALLT